MKKLLAMLLAALLILASLPVSLAENADATQPIDESTEGTAIPSPYDLEELTVAVTTPITGNFFTSMWGNNTSDMDVRAMIHGYDLVEWDVEEGMFVPDEAVVSGLVVTEDASGDRTYTLSLYDDLYYTDGTQITAWDYAFSFLLTMSREAAEIGGRVNTPEYLRGYEEYMDGTVPYLAGVRVMDDSQMAIIVKGEYLPFFYELGLLDCLPYPISVIAPGVRVADDGQGVYLTNVDETVTEPVFTADLLAETILDPETGYRTNPSVTSGPYILTSWENGEARFELNPMFKGDPDGLKPTIPSVVFKSMGQDELIPALQEGTVTLVNKATGAELIQEGTGALGDNPLIAMTNYARTGLSFISFNADTEPLSDISVRKALAYLIDREVLMQEIVSNYGLQVKGYFGLGQWMYQLLNGTMAYPVEEPAEGATAEETAAYEAEMEAWRALDLNAMLAYTAGEDEPEGAELDAAIALLEGAGWTLNAQGEAFDAANDDVRYKDVNGTLVPLSLKLAYAEGSSAAQAMENDLVAMLKAGGIELTVNAIPMADLLPQYYRMADAEYDMYFLATNFDLLYDPSTGFIENENGEHVWRTSGLVDEKLWNEAVGMRTTEPGDLLTYCTHWLAFQTEISDSLPILPIYSNVYFDFYGRVLHDYQVSMHASWPEALDAASLSEYVEETEELGEGEEEEFEG